jgi:hypothetical protein
VQLPDDEWVMPWDPSWLCACDWVSFVTASASGAATPIAIEAKPTTVTTNSERKRGMRAR